MIAVDTNLLVYAHRRESRHHDARVAALCLVHGVEELLSVDRDFALFPELATRNPFGRLPRSGRPGLRSAFAQPSVRRL